MKPYAEGELLPPVPCRRPREPVRADVLQRATLPAQPLSRRSRQVGMTSVVTRHCSGDVSAAPSDFSARVSSLSSVIASVS